MILISTLVSLAMTISIGLLFYYQCNVISKNITTVEQTIFKTPEDNIYYSNDKLNNFKMVLGDNYLEWFIPIFRKSETNNGYEFTLNRGNRELSLPTRPPTEPDVKKSYITLEEDYNNMDSNNMSMSIIK